MDRAQVPIYDDGLREDYEKLVKALEVRQLLLHIISDMEKDEAERCGEFTEGPNVNPSLEEQRRRIADGEIMIREAQAIVEQSGRSSVTPNGPMPDGRSNGTRDNAEPRNMNTGVPKAKEGYSNCHRANSPR